ncbi:hypothetical protein [Saccharothrix obliqua]|uniref:hypothetical protein n=1 Tax=Saccharothrix obliqua TaxID=2861747 RepID=UPI001C5EFCB3|nr:hypothetical protein [Saccharothrix obliqua]MBW4718742.1 hypothetical protein [Saccharothrix obliqua]
MSEPDDAPLNPEPPRSPGTPGLDDLDVEVPEVAREEPAAQDVREEAGTVEPPD